MSTDPIFWTPAQIAERDGVTPQAVTKAIRQLVARHADTPVERDGAGRIKRVSLAHYDHHRGFFGNSQQLAAPPPAGDRPGDATSRDEALRQEAWLRVQRLNLEYAEQLGRLVRKDMMEEGLRSVGKLVVSLIDGIQHHADDIAIACGKEGVSGVRRALRKATHAVRQEIADALAELARTAPEFDDLLADLLAAPDGEKNRDDLDDDDAGSKGE